MQRVGDYQVLRGLDQGVLSGCLLAVDASGREYVLRPIENPQERDAEALRKRLERARRKASWLQHPGWLGLQEFVCDHQQLYLAGPAPSELTPQAALLKGEAELSTLTSWLGQLVEMLMELHNQRQPFYLTTLGQEHLRVNARGGLQLLGLEVNSHFKLVFRSSAPYQARDAQPEARTDVWSLGQLFQQWLEWAGDNVRAKYRENRGLKELITSMCSPDAERRPSSMVIVKSRLEQLKFRTAHENRGLLARMPAAWEMVQQEYHQFLIGAAATFVTSVLLMGWLFPA